MGPEVGLTAASQETEREKDTKGPRSERQPSLLDLGTECPAMGCQVVPGDA